MTTEIGLQSAHGITMGLDLESALEVSQVIQPAQSLGPSPHYR